MQSQKYSILISLLFISIFYISCESSSTEKKEHNISVEPQKTQIPKEKKASHTNTVAYGTTPISFAKNEECKTCHPLIYEEFSKSQHQNSTIYKDKIHAAVWDLHPQNLKFQQYSCGKCHTPAADNAADFITEGKHGMPNPNDDTQHEGISCASCHRIAAVEAHNTNNTAFFSTEKNVYFGTRPNPLESPFHEVITNNASFNRGDVCLTCHSHNRNKANLPICAMDIKIGAQKSGDNCMYCHMPQVEGSVSTQRISDTHSFHGFPGTHNNQEMLEKHLDLQFGVNKEKNGFLVIVQNQSPHDLFLQPQRLGKLKAKVIRNGKVVKQFKDQLFIRALGKDGKPSFPWEATEVVKNTMLAGKSAVTFNFETPIQKGDKVELTLGYHLVNPKAAGKLKLNNDIEATKFRVIKTKVFTI